LVRVMLQTSVLLCILGLRLIRRCSTTKEVAAVFTQPQGDDKCPCSDPVTGSGCYEPVCPSGYFKCCATCTASPCFGSSAKMELSWRGIPECIRCPAGFFCDGCDVFTKCPPSERAGREGPRISAEGSKRFADCEACAPGKEASLDHSACMPAYKDKCNAIFVKRCMGNCYSEDPFRRKDFTPCEAMKCLMFCARSWSADCAVVVGQHCQEQTTKEAGNGLLSGIGDYKEEKPLLGCNVDCSGAHRRGGNMHTGIIAIIALIIVALWRSDVWPPQTKCLQY